jgi:iron complex transport system substrate-binding protein
MNVEEISREVVDSAFHIYRELGPGLLESVYEIVLARALSKRGLFVERRKPIRFEFDGIRFDNAFLADLVVEQTLVVEVKSLERLSPVHPKQLLTYLRIMKLPLGLLLNFGADQFSSGVKRVVNGHTDVAGSLLRINSSSKGV